MSQHAEVGKAFAGWAEENSGLAVDENFEYTDSTVGNFAAASFAAGAEREAQREPTEAEIEAASKAMYENCAARWHASSSSGKWANAQVHKEYLIKARFALEAARKAVAK